MSLSIAVKTETVKVKRISLELTEADVAAIVADPPAFARQLKHLVNGRAKRAEKPRAAKGRSKKASKRAATPNGRKPRAGAAMKNGAGPLELTVCPHCQKTLAAKYLPLHLKRKHAPATPDDSALAAE